MFQHRGGKQIILRFDMKTRHRTNDISINWMVKASVMNLLLLQEQQKVDEIYHMWIVMCQIESVKWQEIFMHKRIVL